MLTADIKKKKASDVMGVKSTVTDSHIESHSPDMGQMKLKAIMDKVGSDRELESVRDASTEAGRITEKFKKDPSEAMDSIPAYREKLEKLRRRSK